VFVPVNEKVPAEAIGTYTSPVDGLNAICDVLCICSGTTVTPRTAV
jgi:hypothetical protein